jgi:hypothetical protein
MGNATRRDLMRADMAIALAVTLTVLMVLIWTN